MNKYVESKKMIEKLYDDFYINAIMDHNGKNWKYQQLSDNVIHSLENLHDDIIVNIIWKLFDENNENYGFGMLEKFNNYNHKCFDKCVSRLRGEIYDHENDTLITIEYINPYGDIIGCKHIGNFSNSICKSIKRRFDKLNYMEWDDVKQSGLHCMVTNRNYCTNHFDFEYNHNVEWLNYKL